MNLENNIQDPFFGQQQPLNHCSYNNHEHNDKTTHRFEPYDNQQRQKDQFIQELSFRPSTFFFSPSSPKHFQFNIVNQSTANSDYKNIDFGLSICQKINFKETNEKQDSVDKGSIQNSLKRSIRSEKGLRNLSESVYLIVSEMGKAKYKLVSQRLISDKIKNGLQFNKTKDEHNVKRRVYDSLNVLIAAGILQKQGKEVTFNKIFPRELRIKNKQKDLRQLMEKFKIQQDLQKKNDLIDQKRRILQKLRQKKQGLQKIILRNKYQISLQKIRLIFPLIGTFMQAQKMQLIKNHQNEVICRLSHRPILFGDIDLLLRIKEQQPPVNYQIRAQNIYNVIGKIEEDIQSEYCRVIKSDLRAKREECPNI